MPFYIFKVWRDRVEADRLELLYTFIDAPLTEADIYRRAQAQLRELRRAAGPHDGYYVHLVYGEDEVNAQRRLLAQLGSA